MKILITGGAGFIGSNIADAFVKEGHKVIVVDNLSSGNRKNINRKVKFYKADITDKAKIRSIFEKEKPEVVSHHAAQIDVRKSVQDPQFDANVNIVGALNVFESAKDNDVKKFIFASSGGTIYGECPGKAPDENAVARPLSPYGITKFAVEFYLKFYASIYGIKYTILRYANVYGPRQDPHGEAGVVAIFSERMLKGQELLIFGDGKQKRDYVFVGDVVRANVAALKKADNQTINIGTKVGTSVNGLFSEMSRLTGYGKKPVHKPARPGELQNSYLDNGKALKALGWKPSVSLKDGLAVTIDFFKRKS
jgi:UDP-glucose 4-epimerase